MTHSELAALCLQSYQTAGIPNADDIGAVGPRAFVLEGNPAVVVFRGTNDWAGWLTDAMAIRVKHPAAGEVHKGFFDAWCALRFGVKRALKDRDCVLTGHSLGGALATLAAEELRPQAVVTFGCPRVGDAEFAAYWQEKVVRIPDGTESTRYVFDLDPVPHVPGLLAGYRHVCPATWHNGDEWQEGFSWGAVFRLLWQLCGSWSGIFERLWHYHAMTNYAEALAR